MIQLFLLLVIGLAFGFFATQNLGTVPVTLAGISYPQIPIYIMVLVAILIGVVMSMIVGLVDSVSTMMTLSRKDNQINTSQSQVEKLRQEIRNLEIENARIKAENKGPNLMERMKAQTR